MGQEYQAPNNPAPWTALVNNQYSISQSGNFYVEMPGSPEIDINVGGITAKRTFLVPETNWITFCSELIGLWADIGGAITYIPPMSFPGYLNLVVDSINVKPLQGSSPDGQGLAGLGFYGSTNTYANSGGRVVTVGYKTCYNTIPQIPGMPQIPLGTYLTYSMDLSAKMMQVPAGGLVWMQTNTDPYKPASSAYVSPNTLPSDLNPGIRVTTGAYTLSWERVLQPPVTKIRQLRGKVNSVEFNGGAPGTILFLGATLTRQYQFTNDAGFWKVEYKFAEDSKTLDHDVNGARVDDQTPLEDYVTVGWNWIYSPNQIPATNGALEYWALVGSNDNFNTPLYRSGDLNQLFQFEPYGQE